MKRIKTGKIAAKSLFWLVFTSYGTLAVLGITLSVVSHVLAPFFPNVIQITQPAVGSHGNLFDLLVLLGKSLGGFLVFVLCVWLPLVIGHWFWSTWFLTTLEFEELPEDASPVDKM